MIQLADENDLSTQWLLSGLKQVSECFAAELLSDLDCVNELVQHVERYRGKMLRPTLVLVAAQAVSLEQGPAKPELITLAAVTEMVHMATLVHDDILDEAELRRQGATLNHLRGNESAVMLGDYLISHAYHLCSSLGITDISRAIAATTNTVCEGELLQLANRNNWRLDERTYFEIIRRKTAVLTAACCRLGAQLAGGSETQCLALSDYGMKLGMAFQIIDDLLDLTGDTRAVGKSLGRDLAKGKLTLPMIRFLQDASSSARARVLDQLALFEQADQQAEQAATAAMNTAAAELTQTLVSSDALGQAKARAAELVTEAKAAIVQVLDDTPTRALLLNTADRVVARDH